MSRPGVGNPGNKGGGRKSAFQELADATRIHEAFTKGINCADFTKIEEALAAKSGKVNMTTYALSRAFKSDSVLMNLMEKVFPSKSELKQSGSISISLKDLHGR